MSTLPSLGVLEARGMAALLAAADAMLKEASVKITGYHRIGSGWITATVGGDTGAVHAALAVDREEAARVGELIASDLIVHPDPIALNPMPHPGGLASNEPEPLRALGVLETQGIAPLLVGTDAMVKTAAVDVHGWSPIGGALSHVIVRGDVGSVRTALAAGAEAADREGRLHSVVVLPAPSDGLEVLYPEKSAETDSNLDAIGILESTGYLGAVAGSDIMVKTADIELLRLTIGSGGRVGVFIKGKLEEVDQALEAGARETDTAGDYNTHRSVARPDPATVSCFGGADAVTSTTDTTGDAIGLVETRSTVAIVSAVDQMMKTADVEFDGRYKVGAYNTAAVIRGNLSAVRAALDVGHQTASGLGETTYTHLIPAPTQSLERQLIHRSGNET